MDSTTRTMHERHTSKYASRAFVTIPAGGNPNIGEFAWS